MGSFTYAASIGFVATILLPVATGVASFAMMVHGDKAVLLDAGDAREYFDGRRGEGCWQGHHATGGVERGELGVKGLRERKNYSEL